MRAVTRGLPIARWKRNASASAQRCSNEWKPPGEMRGPGGSDSGVLPFIHARSAAHSKVGMMPWCPFHASALAPDQAGAARAEDPLVAAGHEEVAAEIGDGSSSTPKPCTPSTHRSTRSASARFAFTSASASAMRADRQLDARRRVDPGAPRRARVRGPMRLDQVADDLVGGRRLGHRVERDLADGGAGVQRRAGAAIVGDVVIVRGGDDLLAPGAAAGRRTAAPGPWWCCRSARSRRACRPCSRRRRRARRSRSVRTFARPRSTGFSSSPRR